MTQIKICGLRRYEDIDYVNQTKPDYAGFIFAPSKRQVDAVLAKELITRLDKSIKKVGVFVNKDKEEVKNIAVSLCLDALQFHGDETNKYIAEFKDYEVWKAIKVCTQEDVKKAEMYNADKILFDSCIDGKFGGTGCVFRWDIIKNIEFNKPIILAGGLSSDNVEDAIRRVNPQIVDVSSGVESYGDKDFHKMKRFIERVRSIQLKALNDIK